MKLNFTRLKKLFQTVSLLFDKRITISVVLW
jgi:hypothetical protein